MISFRRLRAVFLFAGVSAVVWASGALLIELGWRLYYGLALGRSGFLQPAVIFGFCGFVAGAVYATALGLMPVRHDRPTLSAMRSALFGTIAGAAVFLAVNFGVLRFLSAGGAPELLVPTLLFGALGGITGIAIQRTARRGALPAGDVPAIREGTAE